VLPDGSAAIPLSYMHADVRPLPQTFSLMAIDWIGALRAQKVAPDPEAFVPFVPLRRLNAGRFLLWAPASKAFAMDCGRSSSGVRLDR